jgi:hypothetical protein
MKRRYMIGALAVLGIAGMAPMTGFGQSSRCVILEKQGNMALVSCDGGAAQYVDLRGRADIYKVGDTIDPAKIGIPQNTNREERKK